MKIKTIIIITALIICLSISAIGSMALEGNFISSNTLSIPEVPELTLALTNVYEEYYIGDASDGNIHSYFLFNGSGTATFSKDVYITQSPNFDSNGRVLPGGETLILSSGYLFRYKLESGNELLGWLNHYPVTIAGPSHSSPNLEFGLMQNRPLIADYSAPPAWADEIYENIPEFVDSHGNPHTNLYIEKNHMIIVDTYAFKWAQPAIIYCAEQGYLDGMLSRNFFFSPHNYLDKLFLSVLLGRVDGIDYSQYTEEVFSDVKFENFANRDYYTENNISDWYFYQIPYFINWAGTIGILEGTGHGALDNDSITREHVAVMLDRYIERFTTLYDGVEFNQSLSFNDADQIVGWARESVKRLATIELFIGDNRGYFNPKENLNRAQICQIIYNIAQRESSK